MRTIKFRAWDKQESKYYEPIYEAYKNNLYELNIGMTGDLFARIKDSNFNERSEHESCFPLFLR